MRRASSGRSSATRRSRATSRSLGLLGYRGYVNTDGMQTVPTREQRKAQTRDDLIAAAERLFTHQGFHATRLDAIAADAGYTKGAVYSNFTSKEDLFFAVYERRAERGIAELERGLAAAPDVKAALREVAGRAARRRGTSHDGWLAVFYEFWAHVLRHPEHRARFAAIHLRAQQPVVELVERHFAERGKDPAVPVPQLVTSMASMVTGLSLERLVLPEIVDESLAERMSDLAFDELFEA